MKTKTALNRPRPPSITWVQKDSLFKLVILTGEPRNRPHRFMVEIKIGNTFEKYAVVKRSGGFTKVDPDIHAGRSIRVWEIGDGKRFLGNSIGIAIFVPSYPS